MRQLLLIALFVVCVAVHGAAFKTPERTWAAALTEWQILHPLYFVFAYAVCEFALRRFFK